MKNLNFPRISSGASGEIPPNEMQQAVRRMHGLQYTRPFWKRNQIMREMFKEMFPNERLEELRTAGFNVEATFTETMPYPRADCIVHGIVNGLAFNYQTTFQFQVQHVVNEEGKRVPIAVSVERKKARFMETTSRILAGDIIWLQQRCGKQLHNLPVIPPWAFHELQHEE